MVSLSLEGGCGVGSGGGHISAHFQLGLATTGRDVFWNSDHLFTDVYALSHGNTAVGSGLLLLSGPAWKKCS